MSETPQGSLAPTGGEDKQIDMSTRTETRVEVSVIVPAFNEVDNLKPLLEELDSDQAELPRHLSPDRASSEDQRSDLAHQQIRQFAVSRPNLDNLIRWPRCQLRDDLPSDIVIDQEVLAKALLCTMLHSACLLIFLWRFQAGIDIFNIGLVANLT